MSQELLVAEDLVPLVGDNICEGHGRTPGKKLICFVTQKTVGKSF